MGISVLEPSRPAAGRRLLTAAATLAVTGVLLVTGAIPAVAAAPSDQDTAYLTSNIQTSLAEITIGNLALEKSSDEGVRDLANMTLTDHTAALAKATAVATQLGMTAPTEPSPEQKADAAKLSALSGSAFDLQYAQVQVAGHTKSVASTNTEISSGTDPSVKDYATGYLPVASMHLTMAQDVLTDLGGTPTAVPAGSGGLAASGDGSRTLGITVISLGAVLLVVGLAVFLMRRRSAGSTR